jgi:hypothetical protein
MPTADILFSSFYEAAPYGRLASIQINFRFIFVDFESIELNAGEHDG